MGTKTKPPVPISHWEINESYRSMYKRHGEIFINTRTEVLSDEVRELTELPKSKKRKYEGYKLGPSVTSIDKHHDLVGKVCYDPHNNAEVVVTAIRLIEGHAKSDRYVEFIYHNGEEYAEVLKKKELDALIEIANHPAHSTWRDYELLTLMEVLPNLEIPQIRGKCEDYCFSVWLEANKHKAKNALVRR
jgi:hypothetical protein